MNKYEQYIKEQHWDSRFRYMLLDRMRGDCDYFLGNGRIYGSHLWAGNVQDQIGYMRAIWESFPEDGKPEWLTMEQISDYEREMCSLLQTKSIKQDEQIRLADGRMATLSAVRISDGAFEVMLLPNEGDGEKIVSYQCASTEVALCAFEEIKEKYHIPELTGQYKKLANDLKAALAYGLEHQGTDDGGSSNFDAPTISLPGWDKALVEAAVKTAKLRCFEWDDKTYIFTVPGVGQGYTRTKAAEAMSYYLKEHGYNTGMYYQVD